MSAEIKTAVRDRFTAFNARDWQRFGDLVAPDAVIHFPGMPKPMTRDGWLRLCETMPALQLTIEQQIAEGDVVVTRWIGRSAQPDDAAKEMVLAGVSIDRIVDSKVVEHREYMGHATAG
jgi:ketosteroid isomerase-like protein